VIASVDELVRAENDGQALAEVTEGLHKDGSSRELKTLKQTIENLQAANNVYAELQKVVAAAQGHLLAAGLWTKTTSRPMRAARNSTSYCAATRRVPNARARAPGAQL